MTTPMKSKSKIIYTIFICSVVYFSQSALCQEQENQNDKNLLIALNQHAQSLEVDHIKNYERLLGTYGSMWNLTDKLYGKNSSQSAHIISKISEHYHINGLNIDAERFIFEAVKIQDYCIKNEIKFSENTFWHIQSTY